MTEEDVLTALELCSTCSGIPKVCTGECPYHIYPEDCIAKLLEDAKTIIHARRESELIRRSERYIAIPPGETLKELMLSRGIGVDNLIERTGLSRQYVELLLEGNVEITRKAAKCLHDLFGVSENFWIELDKLYQKELAMVRRDSDW